MKAYQAGGVTGSAGGEAQPGVAHPRARKHATARAHQPARPRRPHLRREGRDHGALRRAPRLRARVPHRRRHDVAGTRRRRAGPLRRHTERRARGDALRRHLHHLVRAGERPHRGAGAGGGGFTGARRRAAPPANVARCAAAGRSSPPVSSTKPGASSRAPSPPSPPFIEQGIPIVGLEPSSLLTFFRDEALVLGFERETGDAQSVLNPGGPRKRGGPRPEDADRHDPRPVGVGSEGSGRDFTATWTVLASCS